MPSFPGLIERGLEDWSNVAFTTDDRSASETLALGASDHNVRHAIAHGLAPEIAIQCATINPARHMRIDQWVGSITPGRYADIVLLDDVESVSIAHVFADGQLVSNGKTYVGPLPAIEWPDWATPTMNVGRTLSAADFAIDAEPGRQDHAGGGAEAVPLERGFPRRGARRGRRQGAARRRRG